MPRFRKMKSTLKSLLIIALVFVMTNTKAQDIHFTQFNMSPLTLNPANTGAHSGMWRANAIYRNQWNSVTVPFVTFAGSIDAPIFKGIGQDDYFGVGLAIFNDRSGDGNLANTSILASMAYHLALDDDGKTKLSLGMQGGYTQRSIDFSRLYFGDEFFNGGFQPGTTGELINPKTDYFMANVGLSWRHAIHEKVSYYLGASAFNLNQPNDGLLRKTNNEAGLALRINGQFGLDWMASTRLMVSPSAYYQTQSAATELVAGAEFKYIVGDTYLPAVAPKVFIGAYTRMGDALLANFGLEWQGFRLGLGYDYNTSDLQTASNGNGGFEIALSYVKPSPLDLFRNKAFPCSRF